MKRNIVKIDENLCNGCGQCVSACAEGAIQMVNGKAKLVSDNYCDGLGACLGECPQGAITIEEREAASFDEEAVARHLTAPKATARIVPAPVVAGGCPGMQARVLRADMARPASRAGGANASSTPSPSMLGQWPVQLHLVSPQAAYFADCDLLVAADCVAFAMGNFHESLLAGRAVVIACPKLDDITPYAEKLAAILSRNNVRSVTVAIMEVPCCRGLMSLVVKAIEGSGKDIPLSLRVIGLDGEVREG
jgi:Pyruvate/2-oxoacid:ferredoxin oxidoreductase delta subunit